MFYSAAVQSVEIVFVNALGSYIVYLIAVYMYVWVFNLGFVGICAASLTCFVSRTIITQSFLRFVKNPKITDHNNEPIFSVQSITDLGY